ncbi:transcription-repair coupling factor [Bifidobacterium margollesii]|uniref:Transcription-repair-coupling factor n=2 Tax=Bifidobacterium margollesii TaxID=2020964 RepID=A0A2N5J9A5_9BIFI|nr:transcription-repair coupling factor [Bifidobacterium margollesii]
MVDRRNRGEESGLAEVADTTMRRIRTALERDPAFRSLLDGTAEPSSSALEPQLTVGAVEGIRPALAAALALRCGENHAETQSATNDDGMVVLVVPSGRDAEEIAGSLESWYDANPSDIAVLRAWETLPHERLSPRSDTVASRMAVFRRLAHPKAGSGMFGPIRLLVMPVRSLIQPVAAGLGDVEPLVFRTGEEIELDKAVARLVESAYARTELVMDRGEFAVRGGILDVFPPTAAHPVRIEFFGDEIDSIREFHASDQRTYGDGLERIWATPCRELQFTEAVRRRAGSLIGKIPNADDMLESISQAIAVEGMESLMPALVDDLVSVGSLLPKTAKVLLCDPERLRRAGEDLNKTADEFLAASWHVAASGQGAGAPISFDEASFLDYDEAVHALVASGRTVWNLTSFGVDGQQEGRVQLGAVAPEEFRGSEQRASQGIEGLLDQGLRVIVTAAAKGTLSRLRRVLETAGVVGVHYALSRAVDGFVDVPASVALLTERDLTGKSGTAAQSKTPKRRRRAIDLMELKEGDYIVHEQHGIGRFVTMQQRMVGAGAAKSKREYLVVEYAPSKRGAPPDRLYIPTDQLDKVSKYIGADVPKLNKLGGSDWAATKAKARKHVKEIAQDLVRLYSARQSARGFAFSPDTPWQKELEDAFPYQETADQLTTIDEVKADMEKPVPMDRLICGDVGFGKTEIAVRAAFKAVQDSKQVAVLVPTTLLVQQHYETFTERFEGFPVNVAAMSRFQTTKQINETVKALADGSVDVVIGTHKLLNPKIKFKDLGLVIIDEEQRFGVEHKETLKALRTNVDVLSLSATPIPRTLEMAITGIREMSTLATPPEDRLPVLTYVGAYEDAQVTAAIRRELLRGGQVFYVHNRVSGIDGLAAHLKELVPEANIGVAHGKMGERQLDSVIRDFWHRDIDVLLCTTIIETGLDISNANTLIVDHADKFGLSQLHQLRGRVGRGRERAYAYFLYDPTKTMTQTAHDRLATIAQNTALGSGYDVAMKDLELRGTGNLLGGEQSGHIEGVGFDLYVRMVSEAVEQVKEPERSAEPISVTIDIPVNASIPESYIDSDKLRLEAYRKLAAARDEHDFTEIREELTDRYGRPPEQLDLLFDVARLRARARGIGLSELVMQGRNLRVGKFDPRESVQMRIARIYKGVQYRPLTHQYLIPTPFQGSMGSGPMNGEDVLVWVNQLLDDLTWTPKPRKDSDR